MKILILAAFPAEASHLLRSLAELAGQPWQPAPQPGLASGLSLVLPAHQLWLAYSGVGTEDAAISTTIALQAWQPDLLLMLGTAGGLGAGRQVGDVVVGQQVISLDLLPLPEILHGTPFAHCLLNANTGRPLETSWQADAATLQLACQLPGATPATVFCSNSFPLPASMLPRMQGMGGGVIEMESAGVWRAAQRLGTTRILTVRAISNLIDEQGQDQGTAEGSIERCASRLAHWLQALLAALPVHWPTA